MSPTQLNWETFTSETMFPHDVSYGPFAKAWLKRNVAETLFLVKGLAKLGNIIAETLLPRQMFPSLAARETSVAETNFCYLETKNVFASSQKHFCFPNTNFAFEKYVFHLSHHENSIDEVPVLLINNVSQQRRDYNNG